jgi:enoyl-CoA hydratase/carnithine racemase
VSALVLREDAEGIATLTLNRPEVLNALSPALFAELRAHLDAIAGETEAVGCVILRGAGRSFCAGNDLKGMRAGERPRTPHFNAETVDAVEALPQPVLASVHGHCYTGALELVLACDLLVAAESARFADTHGRFGLVPMWGMSARLPHRVGELRAKEIMYTGRVVEGPEAARIGLANLCVPDAELGARSLELARRVVASSWFSLRAAKGLIARARALPLPEAVRREREDHPGSAPDMQQRLESF